MHTLKNSFITDVIPYQHHYYMIHVSYCHLLSKSTHRYIKILMYQKLDVSARDTADTSRF